MRQKEIQISELAKSRGVKNAFALQKAMGISSPTVASRLWKGFTRIDVDTLDLLCTALKCSPNDVFGWDPPAASVSTTNDVTKQPKLFDEKPNDKWYRVINLTVELGISKKIEIDYLKSGKFRSSGKDKDEYLMSKEDFDYNCNVYRNKL